MAGDLAEIAGADSSVDLANQAAKPAGKSVAWATEFQRLSSEDVVIAAPSVVILNSPAENETTSFNIARSSFQGPASGVVRSPADSRRTA